MSHDDPRKWHMPGWRIEQRFAPGVLIGNWSEERYKFERGTHPKLSTNRRDFKTYPGVQPDVTVRRKVKLRDEGVDKTRFFHHHGTKYSNNMISWYDENFNKREREPQDRLPELRTWNSHRLSWLPEKSDHPMNGAPTRFGLYESLQEKWRKEQEQDDMAYTSIYSGAFTKKDIEPTPRYAVPREMSTLVHKYNNLNQDLQLRNVRVLKMPEVLSTVPS